MNDSDRNSAGRALFEKVGGADAASFLDEMSAIDPGYARFISEGVYAHIFSRPGLDMKTRELVGIASLVTQQADEYFLSARINAAQRVGASRDEIIEVIVQCGVHAGLPAAGRALRIASAILGPARQQEVA